MSDFQIVTDADQGVHSISDNTGTTTGTVQNDAVGNNTHYSTGTAVMPTVAAIGANVGITVGLIDCEVGNVQKRLLLVDGAVSKDATHSLAITSGKHTDLAVDGLEGLATLLQGMAPTQALTLGISGKGAPQALVKTEVLAELGYPANTIARNKECLDWGDTHFLVLDHDPEPGRPKLDADQFWSTLVCAVPELLGVGRVVTTSTSSEIYDSATGECLQGAIGHHTYLMVRGDVDRFVGALKSRLWATGNAFYKLAKPNAQTGVSSVLERFLLDVSVFSPERVIYEAGAICGEGIEQRRSTPMIYPGAVLDLDSIPLPTDDEDNLAAGNRGDARSAIEPIRLRNAVDWQIGNGKPEAVAYSSAMSAIQKCENCTLTPRHLLYLANGSTVAVKDLTADHDGMTCRDPQEPDYRGGAIVAKIYQRDKGGFNVYSQAHGGIKYRCQSETDWFVDQVVVITKKGERRLRPASKIADALATIWDEKIAYNTTTETFWAYGATSIGLWSDLDRTIIAKRIMDALAVTGIGHGADAVTGVQNLLQSKLAVAEWREKTGIVPLRNGVLDLSSRDLQPHSADNYLCWQLPYDYDPLATCDPIQEWLASTQGGDFQRVQLLRAYLKAVITGRSDLQRFIELVGPGGTGKSTYANLAVALVGAENCHSTDLKTLQDDKNEGANIYGKRLVCLVDAERYAGGVGKFKAMTGGDPLRYEQKYIKVKKNFYFSGMVILAANEAITSSDYTSGLERRRLTVPFTKAVDPSQRRDLLSISNKGISGDFAQYLPGLLNWVLAMPDAEVRELVVNTASSVPTLNADRFETLIKSNTIAEWFDSCCIFLPGARSAVGNALKVRQSAKVDDTSIVGWDEYQKQDIWLYANYRAYCDRSNIKPISLQRFGGLLIDLCTSQLKRDDVLSGRDRNGAYFEGIALRHESHDAIPCPITGQGEELAEPEQSEISFEYEYTEADPVDESADPGDVDTIISFLKHSKDHRDTWRWVCAEYPESTRSAAVKLLDKASWGQPIIQQIFGQQEAA